jgi:4-hydroxy-tetrahydrodipicolinate synthase
VSPAAQNRSNRPDLHGVIVPIVTPLAESGALDTAGLECLVNRLIDAGIHGLFVGGTTGEFLALPPQVRIDSFRCVTAAAAGRVPVIAGIGANCLDDILLYADSAAAARADCLALLPPPYFPLSKTQISHFISAVIGQVELPVVLYNIPGLLGKSLVPPIVEALADDDRIVGIKDSSGDLNYFSEILKFRDDRFRVIMGNESYMLDALKLGADGVVPSIANVIPETCVAGYEAARRGDWPAVEAAQQTIRRKLEQLLQGGTWLDMLRRIKLELEAAGVCQGHLSPIFTGGNGHQPTVESIVK